MKNLLEYLIVHLVDYPEEVSIEEEEQDGHTVFYVSAHEDDIGRIIGHRGKTIKAIRRMMHIVAAQRNIRFKIEIDG